MLERVSKPIHILRLRDANRIGGPEKTILDTALEINPDKFYFTVSSFVDEAHSTNEILEEAGRRGILTWALRAPNRAYLNAISELSLFIQNMSVNIFHAHDYKSRFIGYWALRKLGIPSITTLHGWIQNTFKDSIYVAIDRLMLQFYSKIIVVSRDLERKLLNSGIPGNRLVLLHNAIGELYANKNLGQSMREKLGVNKETKLVATIGRLSPEKGIRDLVNAVPTILNEFANIRILIIGEGPEKDNLEKQVIHSGLSDIVLFVGFLSNIEDIYPELDLIVLPSYTEGLPKVILEALSHGKPVVATSVGGVPEIIISGQTGILVPPRLPESLGKAINNLLSDSAKAKCLGEAGRSLIRSRFSMKARTRKLEEVYLSVLENQ